MITNELIMFLFGFTCAIWSVSTMIGIALLVSIFNTKKK